MRRAALAIVLVAAPVAAQQPTTPAPESRAARFVEDCDQLWNSRDRERFCEVRDVTLKPSGRLMVDGRDNGSVTVYGWDRNEVLVRALIQANGETKSDAQAVAKEVRVETDGNRIRADGPPSRRYTNWAVSYEVWMPRKTDLDAETHNGGIRVRGIEGRIELHAVNGGIGLRDVAGDVRAETTNGGVSAELTGTTWKGQGLDLETTNGGVSLDIPQGYNAELETGTVNGGMNIDFPITVQGTIGRRINTKLGQGGPRIRATTTNGGVRIREGR